MLLVFIFFFFSSRRRHTRSDRDWSSDVCSSDLDGRPVNNIDIEVEARANQTRAEVQQLVLRSPVAEAHLQGTMDDWRALRYQMNVTSTVDLTQLSDVLQ